MPADKTGEMWNVTPTWWEDATSEAVKDPTRIGQTLLNLWDYLDTGEEKWAEACREVNVCDTGIGLVIDTTNSSVTAKDVAELADVLEATPPKGLDPDRSTMEE